MIFEDLEDEKLEDADLDTQEMLLAVEKERRLVEAFVAAAQEYLASDTTQERKQEIMENALKGADYFLWTGAPHIGEHESSVARQADLLTFLDDVRLESYKQGRYISSEGWELFLHKCGGDSDSALVSYKASVMYNRSASPEVLWSVPLDHAKAFLLESAQYVFEHPRMRYLDPPHRDLIQRKMVSLFF